MRDRYVYDPYSGIIQLFIEANTLARTIAGRINLDLLNAGSLSRRPHVAFENDIVAFFLAPLQIAEIGTNFGEAWIDSSKGFGELETNDAGYVYDYLTMPETVKQIQAKVDRLLDQSETISNYSIGYSRCYDPGLQVNN